MMVESQQLCTFYVASHFFGIEVLRVQEVLRAQDTTPVPLAPPVVQGLINLRGRIVTALDLRLRMGFGRRNEDSPMNVVVRDGDSVVSLLVDEIGDVIDCRPDRFEPPPENLPSTARELIRQVYKHEDQLLLLLDCSKVLAVEHPWKNRKSSARGPEEMAT